MRRVGIGASDTKFQGRDRSYWSGFNGELRTVEGWAPLQVTPVDVFLGSSMLMKLQEMKLHDQRNPVQNQAWLPTESETPIHVPHAVVSNDGYGEMVAALLMGIEGEFATAMPKRSFLGLNNRKIK
jgi:hypothetical protein